MSDSANPQVAAAAKRRKDEWPDYEGTVQVEVLHLPEVVQWTTIAAGILAGFWAVVVSVVLVTGLVLLGLLALGKHVIDQGNDTPSGEDTELPQDMTSQQIRNLYGSLSECAQGGQFEFDTCTYAFTGE